MDEKWSDTFGTDQDYLDQGLLKTSNTGSTRKQVVTYVADLITASGDVSCWYKYSYSGEMRTYSHTFKISVQGRMHISIQYSKQN